MNQLITEANKCLLCKNPRCKKKLSGRYSYTGNYTIIQREPN